MRQDERVPFARALERARTIAYAPGEYVGQESFMGAGEILALARQAKVGPGVSVLDVCCGVAGPGRFITATLDCAYLGVDSSPSAIALAREHTQGLCCRFEVAEVPPLPSGPFEVVLLLETMLAFSDKETLLCDVARALAPGGRFACTVEVGEPLTNAERRTMPDADTVWPVDRAALAACLDRAGLRVRWMEDVSDAHRARAEALTSAYAGDQAAIASLIGGRATDELLRAHQLWSQWLATGRVRKFAVVAGTREQDP